MLDLNSQSDTRIPFTNQSNPISVDFDPISNTIFWTDVQLKQIRSAGLDGKGQKVIVQLQQSVYLFIC